MGLASPATGDGRWDTIATARGTGMTAMGAETVKVRSDADHAMDPRVARLLALWHAKRGAAAMPSRADFAFTDFRPWLGHLAILETIEGGTDFRYVLYGTRLVEIFGFDLTGLTVRAAAAQIGLQPLAEYRRVQATGKPDFVSRMSPANKEYLTMTKLALPLSGDGRTVDRIISVIYRIE